MLGWQGGTFFIDFYSFNGENGSDDVGDVQGLSNIDLDASRDEIAELWYEQVLLDGKVRVKIGKVEANSEFDFADNAGDFMCSSPGCSPTIFVFLTYPDPATSVNVFIYPNDSLYVGAGLYDGAGQEGISTGLRGPETFFGSPSDLFIIGEAGMTWECAEGRPGRLAIGG